MLFAGTTVVISLLGMLVMGLASSRGLAVGAAVVVAITMVASLTLLPALLGFAGQRVEVTRWRGLIAAGLVAVGLVGVGLERPAAGSSSASPLAVVVLVGQLRRRAAATGGAPPPATSRSDETLAYRWSRFIQHHPWPRPSPAPLVLLVLAVPVLGLRLGFSDEGNYPEDTTTRKAYDLLAEGFGPGFNGPLLLVAELPAGTDPAALEAVTEAVAADPGRGLRVARPSRTTRASPTAALWRRRPDDRAAGRRRPPTWSTACATTCCPPATAGTGARRRRHRRGRRRRRLLRLPRRPPAAASSAPCWRCRSCC